MPEENKSRIEDIKRHLYDPEDSTTNRRREGILHQINHKVSSSWGSEQSSSQSASGQSPQSQAPGFTTMPQMNQMKKPHMSGFKKFFIAAIIFFIGAISFAAYMFFNGGVSVSSDNIDITVLGNAFTKGGDELPLQIEVVNRNNANLELADLIVEYPRGASDNTTDVVRLPRMSIGTIKPGESVTRNVKATLFGDEKLVRNIKITLEYHPEGSNAIFTKDKEYPVTISSAPLALLIDAPSTATSDQIISMKITATLNTTLPYGDTMLQVTYPNNFVFDSATPGPAFGNSIWSLSQLTQTTPVNIVIKGKLVGQDGDQQVFHVYAGTTSPSDKSVVNVVYNSLLQTMTITKPFLEAHILVDGEDLSSYTASGGDTVRGEIQWANNLSTRITDAQIIGTFSGNAFDKSTVNPIEGFFDSANNQIIWDKNTVPELESVEPGARGRVAFTFKPISLVGASGVKDPQIAIDVSIKGRQPAAGSTFSDVNNFAKKVIKILSDLQIASSATFSAGAMPPKAETETKYMITWTLSNSSNSVTSAIAKSVLPIYVKWVGGVVGGNENISYNAVTREVIWNIGTVRPNTGFDSNREVSFILSLSPSLSQVGSVPQLMKDIYLTGQDTFAGTEVKSTRGPITTLLSNDPSFKPGDERVVN